MATANVRPLLAIIRSIWASLKRNARKWEPLLHRSTNMRQKVWDRKHRRRRLFSDILPHSHSQLCNKFAYFSFVYSVYVADVVPFISRQRPIKLLVRRNGFHVYDTKCIPKKWKWINLARMRNRRKKTSVYFKCACFSRECEWYSVAVCVCVFVYFNARQKSSRDDEHITCTRFECWTRNDVVLYEHRKFIIILMFFGSFFTASSSFSLLFHRIHGYSPFHCRTENSLNWHGFCRHVIFIRWLSDKRYV